MKSIRSTVIEGKKYPATLYYDQNNELYGANTIPTNITILQECYVSSLDSDTQHLIYAYLYSSLIELHQISIHLISFIH